MAAHGFVEVEGTQAGAIGASEPHVAHDDDLEGIVRVAEALRQGFASRFVAEAEPVITIVISPWSSSSPAHHGLALQRLEPLLEVFDDVLGGEAQAFLGTDDGLKLGLLALEPLLALDLLALGDLLEVRVDPGSLGFSVRP